MQHAQVPPSATPPPIPLRFWTQQEGGSPAPSTASTLPSASSLGRLATRPLHVARSAEGPLQQQVELLTAKLAAEAEARRALQRRLAEQRTDTDRALAEQQRSYEARLRALQQDLRGGAEPRSPASQLVQERILAGAQVPCSRYLPAQEGLSAHRFNRPELPLPRRRR